MRSRRNPSVYTLISIHSCVCIINEYVNCLFLGIQGHQMLIPTSPMWMRLLWRLPRILNLEQHSQEMEIQKFHLHLRDVKSIFLGRWIPRGIKSAARFSILTFGWGWSRRGILMPSRANRGRTASHPSSRVWTRMSRVLGSSSDSSKRFIWG